MQRLLIACLVSLALSSAVYGAEERYVIQDIVLMPGSHVPRRIVIGESRLKIGSTYTEAEIRQGIYRIRRLPFVFRASYRLRSAYRLTPEGAPGIYTLLIAIEDMRHVLYDIDFSGAVNPKFSHHDTASGSISGRVFVGSTGVAEASVGGTAMADADLRGASLAYTAYDLLGRGAFATIAVSKNIFSGSDAPSEDPTPTVRLGIPLTRVQTLVASFHTQSDHQLIPITQLMTKIRVGSDTRSVDLLWMYQTTDDPFLPLRGTDLQAGPRWTRGKFIGFTFTGSPLKLVVNEANATDTEILLDAARYWQTAKRSALWARFDADTIGTTVRGTSHGTRLYDAQLSAGWAHNLHEDPEDPLSSFRGELGLSWVGHREETFRTHSVGQLGIVASFIYRQPWGLFRISGLYFRGN